MINFDSLPKENPFSLPKPDCYRIKITGAEMKKSGTAGKAPYLSLKYALTSKAGKGAGNIFDIITESDSSVSQYKLSRLLRACGIPLMGQMQLSDIGKLILNKDIAGDVSIQKGQEKAPNSGDFYPDKAQIDVFKGEAFYTGAEFEQAYNNYHMNDEFVPSTVTGNEDFMNVDESDEPVPFDETPPNAEPTPADTTESAAPADNTEY